MALSAWDKTRVYGTWYAQDGERLAGTYQVNMPVRVTIEDGEAIVPAGIYASGDLNTLVAGSPALDVMVPANDDADVTPLGWQISVTVTLTLPSGAKVTETYVIDTPVGGEVNLRTIPLAQTIPPTQTMLLRGVAGGVAALDSDGDVIDADGNKITGGGEGGGQGPKGDKGDKGDPGVDGLSAYEVAVDNGFEGTEGEWLESLVGPTGADGQDGAPGADGSDGAQGEPGEQGEKGDKGDKGDTGDTGPAGPTAVSEDAGNTATLGTDDLLYVPATDLSSYATTSALTSGLSGKADTSHTHTIANVTGLQSALDGKQAAGSYATAAQGALADTAVQPAAIADHVTSATVAAIWTGTQSAYDGLGTYSPTTLYLITEDD